jgi:hypothetical protein
MILSPLTNYKRSVYPQSDLKWKKGRWYELEQDQTEYKKKTKKIKR